MPLTRQQALDHFHSPDLIGLGFEADAVRRRLHPEGVVTYIIDRNINYTNFCTEYCTFCAFYRPLKGKIPGRTRATFSNSKRSTRRSPRRWRWAAPAC
jgi:cyclic dehypoxanthinyl futalosine synthase